MNLMYQEGGEKIIVVKLGVVEGGGGVWAHGVSARHFEQLLREIHFLQLPKSSLSTFFKKKMQKISSKKF